VRERTDAYCCFVHNKNVATPPFWKDPAVLFLRLIDSASIIEITDAEDAAIEDDLLVCRAADGHVVCRVPRLEVLAYSKIRASVEEPNEPSSP
jgi:hypothetical protein